MKGLDVKAKVDDGRTALQVVFDEDDVQLRHISTVPSLMELVKWLVGEGKEDIEKADIQGSEASALLQSRKFSDYLAAVGLLRRHHAGQQSGPEIVVRIMGMVAQTVRIQYVADGGFCLIVDDEWAEF
jgi:hypothetical protein